MRSPCWIAFLMIEISYYGVGLIIPGFLLSSAYSFSVGLVDTRKLLIRLQFNEEDRILPLICYASCLLDEFVAVV